MAIENSEVLKNLRNQKEQIENQLESLRNTYFKVIGAIEALEQIEEENSTEQDVQEV
jgi:hypothetical protein